jgi:hypothetical protein
MYSSLVGNIINDVSSFFEGEKKELQDSKECQNHKTNECKNNAQA